ncbi:holin [Aureibacillus halotolerans]|uniref:A118-like holin Hol118 n=1 Tax=Aureibacillus halotolerans TaxID=1508390 RepID=A0A4R6TRJ2_9BACI|nr:holin [Aureibacillus halotolerans]TDQ35302.1 A118-like holin Hol118 [Aureibacillus halotolerans]
MNEIMNQFVDFTGVEGAYIAFVALAVTLVVQGIKKSFPVRKNLLPVIALGVGLIVAFLSFPFTDLELSVRLWVGAVAGFAGTGLFETINKREGTTK